MDEPLRPVDLVSHLLDVAGRRPGQVALAVADRELTYEDLVGRSRDVASGLAQFGVRHGDRVALMMASHEDLVVAAYGVWRLGAIVLLVNAQLGPDEVAQQFARATPLVAVADDGRLKNVLNAVRERSSIEHLTTLTELIGSADGTQILGRRDVGADATIAFTSGTTGEPKGATHTHRSLFVQLEMAARHYRLRSDDRALSLLAIYMLPNLLLGPLVALHVGSTCRIMTSYDPRTFLRLARSERITYVGPTVPTLYWDLLDLPHVEATPEALASIRIMGCGGAPMPADVRRSFEERYNTRFVHAYGTTEAPALVSTDPIDGDRKLDSVGLPLPHIRITIEDDDGNALAAHEVGEICTSPQREGPYRDVYEPMRGYWEMPERTAEVLDGKKLRSGDLGFLDDDGHLHISDRKKDMIIRGGSNIYPKELEDLLHADDRVAECAVVGAPHPRYGEVPVAFVRARDSDVASEDLLSVVNERVARYKHLSAVHFVDDFPRNALGKILKRSLRERL